MNYHFHFQPQKKFRQLSHRHAIPEPTCDCIFNFSYLLFKYAEEKDKLKIKNYSCISPVHIRTLHHLNFCLFLLFCFASYFD